MELRTERRIVTCLFVDIVGSTDGTARLGPELMQRRLGDAFAQMSAMIGDAAAAGRGLAAYAPDLRLWDRAAAWDFSHLIPAIALTVLERWAELGPPLARLDACAAGGSRLAGAAAAAIREEQAAAGDGPAPTHGELRALGYLGVSEILRFRPAAVPAG